MPSNPTTTDMGALHEEYLAEVFGGTKTGSSGNQWDDQLDGYNAPDDPFSFRWDGKSTKSKQIAITLDMIAKVTEQAQGYRPAIPLRWYGNEKLTEVTADWVALKAVDFSELLEAARAFAGLQAAIGGDLTAERVSQLLAGASDRAEAAGQLADENRDLRGDLERARETIRELSAIQDDLEGVRAELEEERKRRLAQQAQLDQINGVTQSLRDGGLESLRGHIIELAADRDKWMAEAKGAREGRLIPPYVPRLPWTVIYVMNLPGRAVKSGMLYGGDGHVTQLEIGEVRVERSVVNRPRLIVNNVLVPDGDMYVNGMLQARVSSDPSIAEKG